MIRGGWTLALVLTLVGCAAADEAPARVHLHRLTRSQFSNSLRDLLGAAPASLVDFPADDRGHGFDTVADALTVSPLLFELVEQSADEVLEIALDPAGPHRARLVPCDPAETGGRACAREVLAALLPRAFRRPVRDDELASLLELHAIGEREGGFDEGLRLALKAALMSPSFLFRSERRAGDDAPARLDGFELAARLAAFLWSSAPDDRLLAAAAAGDLEDDRGLDREVRRMLDDPRARALTDDFAGQWLQIRALADVFKDRTRYPAFDEPLRASMKGEADRFFQSFVAEDRDLRELLSARDTFVDERLADLYGLPHPGDDFVRVDLTDAPRRGILTQAALMTALSHPFRTAPALRGRWVLENLLCEPMPPPPPGVDAPLVDEGATERERMELHRADPACAGCHAAIDPIGLAFENYDGIGRFRALDDGAVIDPAGELPSGERFAGATELAGLLAADPAFVRCAAEKALTYALGRGLGADDHAHVDAIAEALASRDYGARELFVLVATSEPFVSRAPAVEDVEATP